MKKIGVMLSGCGNRDGGEIHESVLTLLYIDIFGAEAVCFAPDRPFTRVIDHATGNEMNEKRNVLKEAARIARGKIQEISTVNPDELDALIIPGGAGPVINLSNYAFDHVNTKIDKEVDEIVKAIHKSGKPIGAICIAPALLAKILQDKSPEVTIGTDIESAKKIESFGGIHKNCGVESICIDKKNRLVTTPAYMTGPGIKDIAKGIEGLVKAVIEMI